LFDLAPKRVRQKGRSILFDFSFVHSLSVLAKSKNVDKDAQKQQKQRSRTKSATCVEFRSKKETAIRGNIRRGKNVEQFGPKRVEENIPRGRVHDRDAIVLRVQILREKSGNQSQES